MILGKYFITIIVIAVVKMAVGTSVCTYKRCKTCELIKETSESEEPMFMVTKKAVSQLGSACDLMLSSKKHCCDNFLYDSRSMFASKEQNIDPSNINDTFGLIYMAVTALVILSLIIGFLSWRLYKKDTEKTKRANDSSNASILPSKRPSSTIEGYSWSLNGHECCI